MSIYPGLVEGVTGNPSKLVNIPTELTGILSVEDVEYDALNVAGF
jgi:hypothetical protein